MKTQINKIAEAKTVRWANGTSTELFVFPADGNFQTRDFTFRISTATVEAEETDFSDFSGLTRILMILDGNLSLTHEGRYTKKLAPLEQDTFDGGWKTKSKGKVRDFNVMFKSPANGNVKAIHFTENEIQHFVLNGEYDFFFVHSGRFECNGNELSKDDLFIIEHTETSNVSLECLESGSIIHIEMNLQC